ATGTSHFQFFLANAAAPPFFGAAAASCCESAGCLDFFQIILAVPPRFFYDKMLFCEKHPSETHIYSVSHFAPINKRPIFVSRHFHKVSDFFYKEWLSLCAAEQLHILI
ncbi:hypothetical protein, partial [Candidatus Avelusimicrobium facis]|uniref:hypothetical protein n=1 Tax=Candidatus Avelusimicrobium facis TaxID=3416203 RepID=UPI0015B50529